LKRLIISRKGADAAAGGFPSPILPDGQLISIPIPDPLSRVRYEDIACPGGSIGELISDLSRGRLVADSGAHLDPDLRAEALPRLAGWRPLFGQAGSAQTHLDNHNVGEGDVFVFFGWFREVERVGRRWRYVRHAADQHVLFGWLAVSRVLKLLPTELEPWMQYHPHADSNLPRNTLFVAADRLTIDGGEHIRGAAAFPNLRRDLVLTVPGGPRSKWALPLFMYPEGRPSMLSYHSKSRWSRESQKAIVHSVRRGQEFVLNVTDYPEASTWLLDLCGNFNRG
jgi:Nucleotide modification associated domain 3